MRQTAQDQRAPLDQFDIVVIVVLPPNGHDVAHHIRRRIPSGPQGVGDDVRALAGRNEKKVVAEILDRCVRLRRIGDRAKAARHIQIAASGFSKRK